MYFIMCLGDLTFCVCDLIVYRGSTLFSRVFVGFLIVMSQGNIIGVLCYLSVSLCVKPGEEVLLPSISLFIRLSVLGRDTLRQAHIYFDAEPDGCIIFGF